MRVLVETDGSRKGTRVEKNGRPVAGEVRQVSSSVREVAGGRIINVVVWVRDAPSG